MGEVWVADQSEPVRRRVALKVVRPGLDSAGLLARFDQERQALALMDHPNIAKVLDAGVEEAGRPYFAATRARDAALQAAAAEGAAKETANAKEAETRAVLGFVEKQVFAAAGPKGYGGGLGPDVSLRKALEAALPFVEKSFTDRPLIEA